MDAAAAAVPDFALWLAVVWADCGVPGLVQAAAPLIAWAAAFAVEVQEVEAVTVAEDVDVATPLLDGI